MSDRDSTVTYRDRKYAGTKRPGLIRGVKSFVAGAIVAGLVATGATPAMANIGGGGVGGGGGNSGPADYFSLFTGDFLDASGTPTLWGQASTDAFASAMEQSMQWATAMQGRTGINTACNAAMNQAIARSNGVSNRARVVQVGVSVDTQNGNWYMGWGGTQTDMRNWYTQQTNANYWQPMLPNYPATLLSGIYDTFYGAIGQTPRVVCVALNDSEVANYTLELSTDKNTVFSLAGSTAAVSDRINTSRAGSNISENITANISLTWGGLEGNPRTVAKSVTVPNYGVTNSPAFTPAEFGWASWPAGKFWFNVAVPKQGRMKAAVSHDGVNDPRENWTAGMTAPRKVLTSGTSADPMAADEVLASGQFYNAEISARTNGYASSMTITDTIGTDKVWIGSQTGDVASAAYVRDPSGARVTGATVRIDRTGSAVTVTGTVTNMPNAFQAQEYTLVVPTYMRPTEVDYTIRDTSRVCYTAALTNCLDGNAAQTRKVTPAPDKSWVLNANGALTNAAVDGKVFAPNSAIGAVVNGSIPAKLAENLSQYSITDDWSGAARYIDFSDTSKVRVFLDGTNVTNQFTITISGNKTIATAKPAFLNNTKGLSAAKPVKLYIGGTFRSDYDTDGKTEQLTNAGAETWNNETIETNTPSIFTVTPDPDKHWVLDQNGALTNDDVDGKAFAPNARISAVVNGSIPANLGSALTSYSITDDWSAAARYIDFSDASKARVFLNGTDVTSQFDITISGNKTVATAKAAFLTATKGRAADAVVKLFIAGKFRSDYDTAGVPRSLTNSGSESWNGKVVTTNTPAIYTVTPDPNKVWVLDEDGALTSTDKDKANDEGVDGKTFAPGAGISAVVNGSLPTNLAEKLQSYVITDDWTASARYVDFSDASQAKVFLDGRNVTNEFTVAVSGNRTIATAKQAFLDRTIDRKTIGEVKLFITGSFRNDYDTDGKIERVINSGSESWNGKDVATNSPAIYAVTPTPDKVWVLDEDGALSTSDKDWANNVGADGKIFLGNDAISAVVNGSIPANLGSPLYHYSIVDDWTKAATYVDFSDATKAKVFYDGKDVTSGFDINVEGTKTTAVAKAPFLAATKGLAKPGAVKLVVSGQFRDDFDTDGKIVSLTNSGSETWNNRTDATNSPAVFAWSPNPNKQVLGSAEESGDKAHDNINGASVWPGQKLEYRVGVDLRVPAGTARGVKTLAIEDVYDPFFMVDKSSVEFWDSRDAMGPKPVPRSAYELRFDEAAHTFTATFTDEWIAKNVSGEGANDRWLSQGWLTMRVTGMVSKAIPAGNTVVNQAFQIINGNRTATEIPTIEIPTVKPDKDSLSTDEVDIDGKTLVQGDVVLYRLTLDAGPARDKLAYNVHKLGIVDDFDEEFLDLEESDITVTEKATGNDVTSKFNVQIKDGVAYVFAKTVDTEGVYGGIIPGDPQAADLAAFDAAAIRPLEDPIIDQALLGQLYNVNLRATVSKEQDGHVIENQARQNIQNVQTTTRIVSNPIKDIDPSKDAVISEETKDDSIEGTEVRMNTVFNYRLNSSEIPADRAYAAKSWKISDTFDRAHDQYTGVWAIYANIDVYNGDEHLFKKGALLQDSAGHESVPWADLFDVKFDEDTYTFTATATKKYLDLVGSRPDLANAFSVYTKMVRVAPGENIVNQATEAYNGFDRVTNEVDTYTIEYPDLALEKFTQDEGREDGVHRNAEGAYILSEEQLADAELDEDAATGLSVANIQKGVDVGIRFENTGDVPLKEVTLTDVTHDGRYGDLEGLVCAVPADPTAPGAIIGDTVITPDENGSVWVRPESITELSVGQVVDCRGTLRGMKKGMTHGDTAVVTGKSIFTDTVVKAHDTWYAKALSTPGIEIVEYTFEEGREKGDRNKAADAFVLTPAQAANGVFVGVDVTNTGDEPLSALEILSETNDGFEGSVKGITWYDLVEETLPDTDPKPEEGAGETAPELEAYSEDEAPADGEGPAEDQPSEGETPVEEPAPAPETVELNGKQYVQRSLEELTDLEVGASALLLGTLVDVKEDSAHRNEVTVTASGTYSGTAVSDDDPWNARFPLQPRSGAAVDGPKGAVTGEGLNSDDTRSSLLGAAALMTIAAAMVAEIMRRRQKARRGW
ncbi:MULTISPECIES: LPXTG cell wall anchor domain-containing protein [unclassified Microbacterium]|uniref:LPXTG cell wall anchor domain-containing protein n=1 Tax=unclassified Microbacterium TaxID=2609290 RepID=UPI0028831DFA|nr:MULTISPECIES: LPXTG cell wall anchor domain-containing protein [unclassified Microbacterium]